MPRASPGAAKRVQGLQGGPLTSDRGTSWLVALFRMADVCLTAPTVLPSGYGLGRK